MATKTSRGWVPKDEDSEETIRRFNKEGKLWAIWEDEDDCVEDCLGGVKQVELTITCEDVKEKKK